MQKKIKRYNIAQLGDILMEREDGTMRILVCQMGGCASIEMRGIKMRRSVIYLMPGGVSFPMWSPFFFIYLCLHENFLISWHITFIHE
jgi:hypothetical protein